jgi:hypothetical protein
MKKLQMFLAIAALAPMLAACAPSNEAVCQHLIDLVKKEAGDSADKEADKADAEAEKKYLEKCAKEMEEEKTKLGDAAFKKQVSCIMDAKKYADLEKCEPEEEKKE